MRKHLKIATNPEYAAVREALLKALPEFALVRDSELREKVLHVWQEALRRGGWAVEDLSRIPSTLRAGTAMSLLHYVRGVAVTCYRLAEVMLGFYGPRAPLVLDVLAAGALLHDVGKLLEYRESGGTFSRSSVGGLVRHPVSGAALCFELGLPVEVIHLVANHSVEGEHVRRSAEAALLHHVVRLSQDIVTG
ncbi:MAG: HD domain-containing protein [Acidobacteria bacterium]|nr:HD domain-containing protein [Acidobacteriota bacterium]